jgi:hypothetical protein
LELPGIRSHRPRLPARRTRTDWRQALLCAGVRTPPFGVRTPGAVHTPAPLPAPAGYTSPPEVRTPGGENRPRVRTPPGCTLRAPIPPRRVHSGPWSAHVREDLRGRSAHARTVPKCAPSGPCTLRPHALSPTRTLAAKPHVPPRSPSPHFVHNVPSPALLTTLPRFAPSPNARAISTPRAI